MLAGLMYAYLFILGLLFGSFFNVVGIRTADKQSIVTPRSHCPNCQHVLKPVELIPVLSYLWQKGRCTQCQIKISVKYPLFELLTACLFAISPIMVGWSKELLIALPLMSLLIIVTISDLYKMLIPNRVLIFFFFTTIVTRVFIPTEPWWDAYVGAIVGFALLYLVAIVSKGGMGGGDVKLFGVLGLFLGLKGIILTLFLSAFVGMLVGIVLILTKRIQRRQPIPFAPFIALSASITYFTNTYIWELYFQFIS